MPDWSSADLAQLAGRGIPLEEAERQLALLRRGPAFVRLVRPATLGDGIERAEAERGEELRRLGDSMRRAGRVSAFVPASGAATRMFQALVAARAPSPELDLAELHRRAAAGDAAARDAAAFVEALPRLALARPLAASLGFTFEELIESSRSTPLGLLLAALLEPEGLDALRLPKALLPFHLRRDRAVTAFEEQLDFAAGSIADASGEARLSFTVPPGGAETFEAALAAWRAERTGARLSASFTEQSPATDTLAIDAEGSPARTADGRLLFRPAGHGALMRNLEATRGDLVVVRNIDNILPENRHATLARARLLLLGRLVELERRSPGDRLVRPLRVCGVVPNAGEPGGGPFWVADAAGGESLQIVESAQVDPVDPEQQAIWRSSTHFNPVDLALSLRTAAGEPHELARFVDPATSIVTRKSEGGRELTVLERPGLWNGAMAGWRTVFVEIPAETFAPVKSVLDLARPEHAAAFDPQN